jgi:hypothetical protein
MDRKKNYWLLTPSCGTIVFVILYITATFFYPGGSQIDKNSIGFSLINNYWCNLLNDTAINGSLNPAKPIALAGLIVLCLTLAIFWIMFPKHINQGKAINFSIQISGILSMAIAFLLFTNLDHDLVTNLSSLFGILATSGTVLGLHRIKWYGLFAFGLINFLLVGLNSYVYYEKDLIIYLPVIQKISFASFLIWVCSISINLYQRKTLIQ